MAELNMKMAQMNREKEFYESHIENLRMEKEDMIQNHTIETGELRKKITVLTDHVQRLETQAMPSNTGFANNFNELEGMAMDGSWDNMGFINDFPMETEVKQEMQLANKKPEVTLPSDVDKPASQGGLLFMLFLVGAFVLSNRSTPTIPRVSEDVREASATLLDNIFKDAGVAHAPESAIVPTAPQPSGAADWTSTASMSMASQSMDGVAPSMLGDLHDSLTQPTQEQTNEQVFSLSAAQYNGLNDQSFMHKPPARAHGRRNLAEALANMRGNEKNSAAEVYTRSLLWDQIPGDVVRNFAKMVSECNTADGGHSLSGDTST